MMGGDKVIKKADQEKGEEKEISAGLDRVVREGSLEERTFEQNLQWRRQAVNHTDIWGRVMQAGEQ